MEFSRGVLSWGQTLLERSLQEASAPTWIFAFFLVMVACLWKKNRTLEEDFEQSLVGGIWISVSTSFAFAFFLLVFPLSAALIFFLVFYRCFVHLYLRRTRKHLYVGLLSGPDVMWAMEHPSSKSIISALTVVDVPRRRYHGRQKQADDTCVEGGELVRLFRKLAVSRLMSAAAPHSKLLHNRVKSLFGYFYWERSLDKSVDTFVRQLQTTGDKTQDMSMVELNQIIADHCNQGLPDNNAAGWEILVGTRPIADSKTGHHLSRTLRFPVLFRVHHSLGDGVSLMRLLLECFADRGGRMIPKLEKLKTRNILNLSNRFHESEDLEYDPVSFDQDGPEEAEERIQVTVEEVTDDVHNYDTEVLIRSAEEVSKEVTLTKSSSFKILKSPFKSLKPGRGSPSKTLKEKTKKSYSPIKGLGTGALITKIPIIKKLARTLKPETITAPVRCRKSFEFRRGSAGTIDEASDQTAGKSTCVVLPLPRLFKETARNNLTVDDTVINNADMKSILSEVSYNKKEHLICIQVPVQVHALQKSSSTSAIIDLKKNQGFLETHFDEVKPATNMDPQPQPKYLETHLNETFRLERESQTDISVANDESSEKKLVQQEKLECPEVEENAKKSTSEATEAIKPKGGFSSPSNFSRPLQKVWACLLMVLSIAIASVVSMLNSFFALGRVLLRQFQKFTRIIYFTYMTPYTLWCQTTSRYKDGLFFGKPLTGEKVVAVYTEEEITHPGNLILNIARRVRGHIGKDVKFSDLLLTCLSRSLEKYYTCHGVNPPNYINVVWPARMTIDDLTSGTQTTAVYKTDTLKARVTRLHPSRKAMKKPFHLRDMSFSTSTDSESDSVQAWNKAEKIHECLSKPVETSNTLSLDNRFTVGLLRLPINKSPGENTALDRLWRVKSQFDKLRGGSGFWINFWLLRFICHILPSKLLTPLISSAQSSLAISNLPGPEDAVDLGSLPLKNIMFWIPNRGLTGVGISVLSYCGRLSFGLMADKAYIFSQDDAQELLDELVQELQNLEGWNHDSQK